MKKIVITMIAAMAFTFSFAETKSNNGEKSVADVEKSIADRVSSRFDMSCDMRRLSAFLELDDWQMEAVEVIHNNFSNEIQALASMRGPRLRHMIHKALRKDARQMHNILNEKQFTAYMTLLSTTLRNRHL